jgi:4-hydroxy-2-oxoheptanedioate aldolase
MNRENKLKKMLIDGGKGLGCWICLDSAISTEVVALAGFDFLLFDQEHGFGDPKQLAHQLQAMSATETTSVVRVPSHDPNYTKRILDAGAECIMFPSVNTAEQAHIIVDSCLYPPVGMRGLAPGIIRAADYGYKGMEYVGMANRNTMVICQIETAEAVGNIEELVAVKGVDMFFIGPNDLSASIGKFAQYDDPTFVALVEKIERAVRESGKLLAGLPYGDYLWQDLFDRGYHMTTAGADISLLRMACAQIVEEHAANNRNG